MANFIISNSQCILIDGKKYLAGMESELSATWGKMSADKRKASQYAHAKNGAVVFKAAPPNPVTGQVDYEAPTYNPVVINVVIPQETQEAQPTQPAQPQTDGASQAQAPTDDDGEVI